MINYIVMLLFILGDNVGNIFVSSNEDERIRIITQRKIMRSILIEGLSHQAMDLSFVNPDYLIIPNVFDQVGLVQVVKLQISGVKSRSKVGNMEEDIYSLIAICAFIQCGGSGTYAGDVDCLFL